MDTTHRTARRLPTVAIVGPGLVGSTTAYALMMSGVAAETILIGRDRKRTEGHVKDLRDAALYSGPTRVVAGELGDCKNADVIVVTGGAPQHQNASSRIDGLKSSAVMVKEVMTQLARVSPTGVVVIASDPARRYRSSGRNQTRATTRTHSDRLQTARAAQARKSSAPKEVPTTASARR